MNAKQKIANIDRERVRSARAAEPLAGLPPTFPGVIVSDSDRRVYIEYLQPGGDLPVTLQRWLNEHDDDEVTVYIAQPPTGTDDPVWEPVHTFLPGDISQRPTEFLVGIPADKLTDYNPADTPSTWWVLYEVVPPVGNEWTSTEAPIVIDRRAHYQANPGGAKSRPPVARATPAVPADDIIDNAYVNNLPGGIWELVVGTQGMASGDKCYFYISKYYTELPTDPPINLPPYTLPLTGKFEVTSTFLRSLPPGVVYIFYRLVDAVGNESKASDPIPLKVMFAPTPVLEEPRVPLASSQTDRLIDLKDCAESGGVTVEIDRVDNVEDTDEIKLDWNATLVDTKAFGTATKLIFTVPFATIFDDYYKDGDDTEDDVPVEVKATLLQGPTVLDESSVDIFSNLYVAGPTDPSGPGLPNPNLVAPNVTSTDVPNVIEIPNYGQLQEITINLWTDLNKPVKNGQKIEAEYAGERLSDVAFLKDNQTTATLDLPWDVIERGGLGSNKPLQYFVSQIGGLNENPSLIQMVTNNAMVVRMDPPEITTSAPGLLRCRDLQRGTFSAVVTIPGNPVHLQVGRDVTLHAQGYRDSSRTQEAPGTDFVSTPHPIVIGEPENGFTMTVAPYNPFIRNIPVPPVAGSPGPFLGYWTVWYSVSIGGTDYPSEELELNVNLVNPGGEYCEGP